MNGIVDLAPLVLDIPQDLVAAGFRFFLRVDGASLDVYPAVSPTNSPRLYLQDLPTAESQVAQSAIRIADRTEVELTAITGGRLGYVFKANGSGTIRLRISLVIQDPMPSQNTVETDSVRCTYANSRDFWLLASARGNNSPTEPYEYRTEDGRAVPSNQFHRYPAPHEYAQGLTGGRDSDRTQYVVWVHGYNNSEAAAISTFDEMHRRLFWLGFRGNFIGFTWHSDEWSGVLPPVVLFDTQVQNAFQTAPSLMLFLRDHVGTAWGSPPENINLVAHSLGNFVAYDALRLHRHTAAAPLINNLVGLESATWPECYLTEQQIAANGGIRYTSDPITYTPTDLKQNSWAFWFGQQNFEVRGSLARRIYHSYVPDDGMLYWMRRNDAVQRGVPTLFRGLHYRRDRVAGLPLGFRSPTDEPGHPNFYNDIPTLMLLPNQRHVPYGVWRLNLPVGTAENPMADYNYPPVLDQAWESGEHSAYLRPLPQMYKWFQTFLAGRGNAPYAYPPAIAIGRE